MMDSADMMYPQLMAPSQPRKGSPAWAKNMPPKTRALARSASVLAQMAKKKGKQGAMARQALAMMRAK